MNSTLHKAAMATVMAVGLTTATTAAAQEAAAVPPPPVETMAAAEDWNPISRSGTRAYLADVASLSTGETVTIRLARTPLNSPAGDYSHTIDDYQFRCGAGEVRIAGSSEYGPDGVLMDHIEEEASWEDIPANSLDAFVKGVACDGDRASGKTWPSIRSYIDAGRP